ncbi:MAG: TolC family protein, partial [Alphaproteobacteria bacterium]|nr:TolC family protein [Alphaproteobacteria bacterium]
FEMLAAQSDLAKAEADVWPRITLSAFFGVRDTSDGVLSASNPIWSLASNIISPVLNFERLNGAIDVANARETQSILIYKKVVLTAITEAKTALSDYLNSINALNQQEQALIHRKMTVTLVNNRFERGLTDMIDLTTAQSELDQATLLMVESRASSAIAYIRLQKALGKTLYNTKTIHLQS